MKSWLKISQMVTSERNQVGKSSRAINYSTHPPPPRSRGRSYLRGKEWRSPRDTTAKVTRSTTHQVYGSPVKENSVNRTETMVGVQKAAKKKIVRWDLLDSSLPSKQSGKPLLVRLLPIHRPSSHLQVQ